jgi:hypothetical protein
MSLNGAIIECLRITLEVTISTCCYRMDNLEADYKTEMILRVRDIYLFEPNNEAFNEADDAILNYLDDDGRLLSPSIISP